MDDLQKDGLNLYYFEQEKLIALEKAHLLLIDGKNLLYPHPNYRLLPLLHEQYLLHKLLNHANYHHHAGSSPYNVVAFLNSFDNAYLMNLNVMWLFEN